MLRCKVGLLVVVLLVGLAVPCLAHDIEFRGGYMHAPDAYIDTWLASLPAGLELRIVYLDYSGGFVDDAYLVAVEDGSKLSVTTSGGDGQTNTKWRINYSGLGDMYACYMDFGSVGGSKVSSSGYIGSVGNYGNTVVVVSEIVNPTNPLLAGMGGAEATMVQPIRQVALPVMIMMVGLVGFAKGWTWLKRVLSGV